MSTPDYKVFAWARGLKDELTIRAAKFATPLAVSQSQDTNGAPLIIVGNVSIAGGAGVTIRLRPIDWPLVQTSISLPQPVYGPHVGEVVYETGIAADTAELLNTVNALVTKLGVRVDNYQSPNGTAADYTQFITANLKSTYNPSLNFGLVGSM